MELTKFCPRCGREAEKLYGEKKKLCADCFPEKNDLLEIPAKVDITLCSVCGRMRKKGEWIEEYSLQDQLAARFEEFSEEDVRMELQFWEEDEEINVRVHAEKGEMQDFYDTKVDFENVQCEECARFDGGFYKVKMQLRGEDLEEVVEDIAEQAADITNDNRKDFLSNIDEVKHGYNFYFSTERIAKKILSTLKGRFDPEVKRSYELMGAEDGQEVYRNVISVRL